MHRRTKRENLFIILFMLVVGLGIGYAFIQTDLTITGISKYKNQTWNVYFEDLTLNPNNVSLSTGDVAATINQTTMTDITFTVTLQKPGDFYEFEVAAVNAGSMDAMVGLITNHLNGNPISSTNPVPAYAKYTATYSDGVEIAPNHLLEAGYSETFKVKVEYRTDIDPEDLPEEEQTFTYTFGVQYVQADDNSISKPLPPPKSCTDFTNDSWETVVLNAKKGQFYEVGCTKEIELGNDLGTHPLRVANISTPAECSTTGFSQTACGFVLEFADILSNHIMNPSGEYKGTSYPYGWNIDGWPASSMYAYLNDTNDSTSIINSLPTVIKDAIIDTVSVSGRGCIGWSSSCFNPDNNGQNFISTDKIYLLSFHEVWEYATGYGSNGYRGYSTAYDNTRQLDYYANLGVTIGDNTNTHTYYGNYSGSIKKLGASAGTWRLRDASHKNKESFLRVTNTGLSTIPYAYYEDGVSPAFRIG